MWTMQAPLRRSVMAAVSVVVVLSGAHTVTIGAGGADRMHARTRAEPPAPEPLLSRLAGVSVPFITNEGQTSAAVAYYAPTFAGAVFVTRDGRIVYSLPGKRVEHEGNVGGGRTAAVSPGWTLMEVPVRATGVARPAGQDPAGAQISYFSGRDRAAWKRGIATYNKVSLGQLWPGVDVTLHANGKSVEKLFTVAPGGDVSRIRMRLSGARSLELDDAGALVVSTGPGEVRLTRPVAYQEQNGLRHEIDVAYESRGDTYGFRVGHYDPARPLVIDPLLQATYLGGTAYEYVRAMALAVTGEVYVAGATQSLDLPQTAGGAQPDNGSSGDFPFDAFVAHLSPDLKVLRQVTYLGGSEYDAASALAVDPQSGNVFVTGSTDSSDFPNTSSGAMAMTGGGTDAFVARLPAALNDVSATYVGGISTDQALAIAISSSGDVYIAGQTASSNFPQTLGGVQPTKVAGFFSNAFVARLPASLGSFTQATYLGGTSVNEVATALAIHPISGDLYVAGSTDALDFPGTAGGAQPTQGGGADDGFVARLPGDLRDVARFQSTYLGGSSGDEAYALAVQPLTGKVYVAGGTRSTNFPGTAGGAQTTNHGGPPPELGGRGNDGYIAQFSDDLRQLVQSTYLGGSGDDVILALTVHPASGEVYAAGQTGSSDLPATAGGAASHNLLLSLDGFITRVSADLKSFAQATYLGAPVYGYAMAIYPATRDLYFAGQTNLSALPSTTGGAQPTPGSSNDGFVARFSDDLTASGCPAITLSPATIPTGTVGALYPATVLTASGGAAPYTFTVIGLPAGMTQTTSSTSVTLGGTPTVSFDGQIFVSGKDSSNCAFNQNYALTISTHADLSISVTPSPSPVTVGSVLTYTVTLRNNGPHQATAASWTMAEVSGLTINSVTPATDCALHVGASAVRCDLAALDAAAQAVYVVQATPQTAASPVTTAFTVRAAEVDPVPSNNSVPVQVDVVKAPTAIDAPTSSKNPSLLGEIVQFSVTVTGAMLAGGDVAFYDGTSPNPIGIRPVNSAGLATFQTQLLAVGSHTITAAYAGDDTSLPSARSAGVTQVVNPLPIVTHTVLNSSQNPSFVGQAVTITATVTGTAPFSGTVTFRVATASGFPVSGFPLTIGITPTGTAMTTIDLPVGTYRIDADYSGDALNQASQSPTLTQTVDFNKSSGTAARAILDGKKSGTPIIPFDLTSGAFSAPTAADQRDPSTFNLGHSNAWGTPLPASLPAPGPTVGAYGQARVTPGCIANCTEGTAAARAIAYAEYRNPTTSPQSINTSALLTGKFANSLGHVFAAVYVIDTNTFFNLMTGQTSPRTLLTGDTLNAYATIPTTASNFSLAPRLFPTLVPPAIQVIRAPSAAGILVDPGYASVPAGQSVIVMYDIAVYSPPGAEVDFHATLKPGPLFLTDPSGNRSPVIPVGPLTPAPPPAATLALTPATTTATLATAVTVTARASTAAGAPVPNTLLVFEIIGGPNTQSLGPSVTDADGQATFTYSGGAAIGTDQVRATMGTLQSNVAEVTWTVGPLDHIAITPATATIAAGASQSYTARALDMFDNNIADVTGSTAFSILPDGSCTGATCTPSAPGTHTVTATYGGKSATATLDATGVTSPFTFTGFFDPVDMGLLNTLKAGQSVPLKWLLTTGGAPVSDPRSFGGLTTYPVACPGAGSLEDAIEQAAAGNSGLQYNGSGYWQYNWETSKSWRNSCRALVVKFSDGTTSPPALFKFK